MKSPGWDAFLAEDVDIVCLQEVRLPATVGSSLKTVSGETLDTVLHNHGFKYFIWHTAGVCLPEELAPKQIALRICTAPAYAGICVFSKIPPLDHTRGLGNELLDAEPRVLTVTFDQFTLVTAYAPSSGLNLTKLPRKRFWNSVFRSHVQRLCKSPRPLIIAADFNATLTPDDDYFGPQHLTRSTYPSCSPEERQDMMALLQIGLVDTMTMARHCGPRLTWAQTAADMNRNRGLRIDYVLVSQAWPQRPLLHTHQVDSPGSDHLPVRASFFETPLRESPQHQEDTLDSDTLKKVLVDLHSCSETSLDTHGELRQVFNTDCVDEYTLHEILPPDATRILEELTTTTESTTGSSCSTPPECAFSPLLALSVNDIANSVLPVSNVRIGDTLIPALWDSGSVHNIASCGSMRNLFSEDDYNKCKLPLSDACPTFLLADGSRVRPQGCILAPIHFTNSHVVQVRVYLLDRCPFTLILGSTFAHDHHLQLDYGIRAAKFDNICVPFMTRPITTVVIRQPVMLTNTVTIPPFSVLQCAAVVPFFKDTDRAHIMGIVQQNTTSSIRTSTGVACLHRGETPIMIMNASANPRELRRHSVVGTFLATDADDFTFRHVHPAHLCEGSERDITMYKKDVSSLELACQAVAPCLALGHTEEASSTASLPASQPAFTFDYDQCYKTGAAHPWAHYTALYPHLQNMKFDDTTTAKGKDLVALRGLIVHFEQLWGSYNYKEPVKHSTVANIDVIPNTQPRSSTLRFKSPEQHAEVNRQVKEQLELGVIRPSMSPWATNVLLIPKANSDTPRFALDYRVLNANTESISYPIPRIQDALEALTGASYLSSMDCSAAYWQIPLSESSKQYTAFVTAHGQYEYNRLPFGIKNAPAIWCQFIDAQLSGLRWNFVITYFDDILAYSKGADARTHLDHLAQIFNRLQKAGIKLSAKKTLLCREELLYLGHIVSSKGIRPDPAKAAAIADIPWSKLKTVKDVRSFMQMCSYYRRYVPDFARISAPLRDIANGSKVPSEPSQEVLDSFQKLKHYLTSPPILCYPDWNANFEIHTDASKEGLGAVLLNTYTVGDKKSEVVVMYASRALSATEKNLHANELEALAVVWATGHFHHFIADKPFLVVTDHSALLHFLQRKNPPDKIVRWQLHLQQFEITFKHRKGAANADADGLSRLPLDPVTLCTEASEATLCAVTVATSMESLSMGKLRAAQLSDEWISACMRKVRPVSDPLIEADKGKYHENRSGLFCQVVTASNDVLRSAILIPALCRPLLLHHIHSMAHIGRTKMREFMVSRYIWPHMIQDIDEWTHNCLPCIRRKTPRPLRDGLTQSIVASRPLEKLCIDFVGPLTTDKDGNEYILSAIDVFTRYLFAFPVKSRSAENVAEKLLQGVFFQVGFSELIFSDRAKEFLSTIMKDLTKLTGALQKATTGYQPQANGVLERAHAFLGASLAICTKQTDASEWSRFLPSVIFWSRVTQHASTGYSPFYLMFGREPMLPLDVMLSSPVSHGTHDADDIESEYVAQMHDVLQSAYESTRQAQTLAASITKGRLDERKRNVSYNVNQLVVYWVERENPKIPRKLDYSWSTPHIVERASAESPLHYYIKPVEPSSAVAFKVHVNSLYALPHDYKENNAYSYVAETIPLQYAPQKGVNRMHINPDTLEPGMLFIYPTEMSPGVTQTWFVAELLAFGEYDPHQEDRPLIYQHMGNYTRTSKPADPLGPYIRTWIRTRDRSTYHAPRKQREHDIAYTNVVSNDTLTSRQAVVYGFTLTDTHRVPLEVQRAVDASPWIDWKMPSRL